MTIPADDHLCMRAYRQDLARLEEPSGEIQDQIVADLKHKRISRKEAERRLVHNSLRFAYSEAVAFAGQNIADVPDLVCEANRGLLEAARRFDENSGNRFITYAVWWIKQQMSKWQMLNCGQMRIPANRHDQLRRIKKAEVALSQKLGRFPSTMEIADCLDWDEERVCHVLLSFSDAVRLNHPVNTLHDGDGRLGEEVIGQTPPDLLEEDDQREHLHEQLCRLDPRHRSIVSRYTGFGPDACKDDGETLEEISRTEGVSRERIRQIKQEGVTRLRRFIRQDRLA